MSPTPMILSTLIFALIHSSFVFAQEDSEISTPFNTSIEDEKPSSPSRKQVISSSKKSSSKNRKRKKTRAQVAIVQVEGAAVYQYPNFDSPVLEYLRAGTKVFAALKPKEGIGGFGAFYRVKLPSKKLGWMADVDVMPQYRDDPRTKSKKEMNPDFQEMKERAKMAHREPIFFEKFVGADIGMVQFTEKFDAGELSSDVTMFGFRSVGPDILFSGPPMDFSFLFSIEAPSHYSKFANGPATGFFLITDILMPFPIFEGQSGMFTLGLGPMLTYTNFQVEVRTSKIDSQEVRLGVVGALGYMHRFSKFAVRLDGKYYFEKTDYYGAHISFLFHRK